MLGIRKPLSAALVFSAALFYLASPAKNGNPAWHCQVPGKGIEVGNIGISLGGYGSDLAYNQSDNTFWLLTDRGPNVDNASGDGKIFPLPDFTPNIKVMKLHDNKLETIRQIDLRTETGEKFTGLPEKEGDGNTGEYATTIDGKPLDGLHRGIDPEGLAIAADGSFWVSDEYGPYLLHFSPDGVLLQKLSPFNGGLPRRYALRRPNRGLEGLCMDQTSGSIFGILQSPVAGKGGSNLLPLFVRKADGSIRDFDYPLSAEAMGVSALCLLNDTTLLVLERDGKFPIHDKAFKRVFKVEVPKNATGGKLEKKLFLDIMEAAPSYDHDKAEGIAIVGDSILVVANDDDFGITIDSKGNIIKKLKSDGKPDSNELWFIPLRLRE